MVEPNLIPDKLLQNLSLSKIKKSNTYITQTSWKELTALFIIMGFVIIVLFLRTKTKTQKHKKRTKTKKELIEIQPQIIPQQTAQAMQQTSQSMQQMPQAIQQMPPQRPTLNQNNSNCNYGY